MKRNLIALMILGLVASGFSVPATAAKKPAKVSLFLHGHLPVGEAQYNQTHVDSDWMKMDKSKPGAGAPSSMNVLNYLRGPNAQCSGNGLLPTWRGDLKGTVKGDVKVTLHTVAAPASKLKVELYPDGSGGCTSSLSGANEWVKPALAKVVDVAPGPGVTTVTFKKANFKVMSSLVLMLSSPSTADSPDPSQVRVLYDSADFASSVQLSVK